MAFKWRFRSLEFTIMMTVTNRKLLTRWFLNVWLSTLPAAIWRMKFTHTQGTARTQAMSKQLARWRKHAFVRRSLPSMYIVQLLYNTISLQVNWAIISPFNKIKSCTRALYATFLVIVELEYLGFQFWLKLVNRCALTNWNWKAVPFSRSPRPRKPCNVNNRKLLRAPRSHTRETSLFPVAKPNQVIRGRP